MPFILKENDLQAHSRTQQKSRGLSTAELHSQQRGKVRGSEKRANEQVLDVGKTTRAIQSAKARTNGSASHVITSALGGEAREKF